MGLAERAGPAELEASRVRAAKAESGSPRLGGGGGVSLCPVPGVPSCRLAKLGPCTRDVLLPSHVGLTDAPSNVVETSSRLVVKKKKGSCYSPELSVCEACKVLAAVTSRRIMQRALCGLCLAEAGAHTSHQPESRLRNKEAGFFNF